MTTENKPNLGWVQDDRDIEARERLMPKDSLTDILQKMASAKLEDSLGPNHLALCLKQMAREALDVHQEEAKCRTCGHAAHHGSSCVNVAPPSAPSPTVAGLTGTHAPIYQVQAQDGNWFDTTKGHYEARVSGKFSGAARVLFNGPQPGVSEDRLSVPAGWKLAPIEPTESMRLAPAKDRPGFSRNVAGEIYAAMLAAAPAAAPSPTVAGLTDDDWFDLASRHANADWSSNRDNGYLNAVIALCEDYADIATSPTAPSPTGLTQAQKDKFVADLIEYGTEFVAPLYAVVEAIEKAALAAHPSDSAETRIRYRQNGAPIDGLTDEITQPWYDAAWKAGASSNTNFDGDDLESITFTPREFESFCDDIAAPASTPVSDSQETRAAAVMAANHDDYWVEQFAVALKRKLADARAKGRGGWESCEPSDLSRMLREHVEKGDPRDVANFCMFLWALGKPIAAPAATRAQGAVEALRRIVELDADVHFGSTERLQADRDARAILAAPAATRAQGAVTDEMVGRFLGWKLPQDFYPDCYITFDREKASSSHASWPTGTNLLHAGQAREMLEHVLAASVQGSDARDAARWRAVRPYLQVVTDDFEEREYMPPNISTVLSVIENDDMVPGRCETADEWADAAMSREQPKESA